MIPTLREHDLQATIVQGLTAMGYAVMETTAYRQRGASGVDRGVPDLLVSHPDVPGVLFGLEVKRPGKVVWSSHEQELAWLRGHTVVVQSFTAALQFVRSSTGRGSPLLPEAITDPGLHIAAHLPGDERKRRIDHCLVRIALRRSEKRSGPATKRRLS